MNAIFSFTGIYFNIKNRPHHILSKDEAKVIFKTLWRYKIQNQIEMEIGKRNKNTKANKLQHQDNTKYANEEMAGLEVFWMKL